MHRTPTKADMNNNGVNTPLNQSIGGNTNAQNTQRNLFTPQTLHGQQSPLVNPANPLKRGAENKERTINDVYDTLINRFNIISNDIKDLKVNQHQFEERLDAKMDSFNEKMKATDEKLVTINEKIDKNADKVDNHERTLNYLMQEKLSNKMEISGYKCKSTNDKTLLLEEIVGIFNTYNIQIERDDIDYAYTRTVNKNSNGKATPTPIIIVQFKDLGTKIRVLKEKREQKMNDGIFFDHCFTAANRSLMGKVKKIAREKKFSTYLSNNRIHVKKSDNQIQTVEIMSDVNIIDAWSPNKQNETRTLSRSSNSTIA